MAAARAVFDTYELLENILLHLPVNDLLLAERVSKVTKSLIADSPRIGQALYRKPFGVDLDFKTHDGDADDGDIFWVGEDGLAHFPIFNPLLNRLIAYPKADHISGDTHDTAIIHNGFVDPRDGGGSFSSPRSFASFMYSQASWKSMLMTQPSLKHLYIFDFRDAETNRGCTDNLIEPKGSLKLGELWKELVAHWHSCPRHPNDNIRGREVASWEYFGDEAIAVVDTDVTGWKLLTMMEEEEAAWVGRSKARERGKGWLCDQHGYICCASCSRVAQPGQLVDW